MNTIGNLLTNLRTLLCCVSETLGYALAFLRAILCSRAVLSARLLTVESQLAACKHQINSKKRPRPRFTASFRLLWVLLSKSLDKWEDFVHLMQPATVKKWHNTAFRYFWRWKSRRKGGRPPISKEMQNLIYIHHLPYLAPYIKKAIPVARKLLCQLNPIDAVLVISCNTPWQSSGLEQSGFNGTVSVYTASGMPTDILKALGKLVQQTSENMMYFFVLPLIVGLYCHFRKLRKVLLTERFFIFALIVLYVVMMVLLHINYSYISRRHCMPIIIFTVFYIPVGLQILARWLSKRTSKNGLAVRKNRQRWFFILAAVGFSICTAKFGRITPLGWKKQGYIDTAKWLKENTSEKDLIAMADSRIGFYAQRSSRRMDGEKIPGNATYVVKFLDGKQAEDSITFNREVQKRYSVWINKKERKRRIVIYEVL